jgi:hypothetical protein
VPQQKPLVIGEQGSFAVGGTVLEVPGTFDPSAFPAPPSGQTLHGDHAYVQYQLPVKPRKYPLVMWHGGGQMAKTWETTPDGREGFQSIFLRRDYGVYIIDQPRRGRAGNTTVGTTIAPRPMDQSLFNLFRIGQWPNYNPNVQFPRDKASLDQFFRQITADTGPNDLVVAPKAVSALLDKIGESVLLTHSDSGSRGWLAALANKKVKGIVAYEPAQFVFPEGGAPPPRGLFPNIIVPIAEFKKLTRIPIQLVYGDYIPEVAGPDGTSPLLVANLANAKDFVRSVNEHGGKAQPLILPEIGIRGNTHFAMSDLNNLKIADLLSNFLERNHLDGYADRGRDDWDRYAEDDRDRDRDRSDR